MKKLFLISSLLFLLCIVVSGCGKKVVMMDELNQKGFYPYTNSELGFDLSLPKDFQYFQTQRINSDNFKDLEIFVPTADRNYTEEVPASYAKPVIVRVMDKKYYDSLENSADKQTLIKVGEKGNKIYVIKFWDTVPTDWKDKWNEDLKKIVISNFKLK
jgi:hypothetical protein